MTNAYVDALQKKGTKEITFTPNKRTEIIKKQDKRCADCKEYLRAYYYKFVIDSKTNKMKAICSNCAAKPKR